ncbi:MAG: D-alanyl-D-alanine carboxypeptidase/D-alanyl-D-alanine-endopeptidase [Acidobacteriota bacterium]|jgi:PBP4 family serine-type D-alanyl-D-alanine carboxypeptidase|nr:D-alanyl-D-alanine carboxypeptidase/D-alanyl-D-alanine-endopeptidase [Acidobacteriota bacterium]
MKPHHRIFLAFIVTLAVSACRLFAAGAEDTLRRDLDVIFADRRLSDAQWGVAVYSLDREESLFEHNAQKLFIPASNGKILTAAAALLRLGPEYRFKTRVLIDGSMDGDILRGNLIVQGFGDPSLSTRMNGGKDPFAVFRAFADRLKARGIKSITGSIAGDAAAFKGSGYGRGWELDDLTEGFAAPAGALSFNENFTTFQIRPGAKAGDAAVLSSDPLAGYPPAYNAVVTVDAGKAAAIVVEHAPGDSGAPEYIKISGTVPLKNPVIRRSAAIRRPVRYYLEALRGQLDREGLNVSGCDIKESYSAQESGDSGGMELIMTHESAPLAELLTPIMKDSLNMPSEMLLHVLGLEIRGEGTAAAGADVVAETLDTMGIRKGSYIYSDASGLSRRNLVSADVFVRALGYMRRQPVFPRFYASMAVSGVDGTLKNRLATVKGNIYAKTGTLSGVSAISGYLRTADGEMLAFSMIANNYVSGKAAAEDIQNRALLRLARFSRKLPVDTALAH